MKMKNNLQKSRKCDFADFISREAAAMHPFPTGFQGNWCHFFFQHGQQYHVHMLPSRQHILLKDISVNCNPPSAALTCSLLLLVQFSLSASSFVEVPPSFSLQLPFLCSLFLLRLLLSFFFQLLSLPFSKSFPTLFVAFSLHAPFL